MALIAVYLGETDESKIDGMSIPFFNSVLAMLGKRVNYDAVVNYAGNSFAEDSWKLIQEANPLTKPRKHGTDFMNMISKAKHIKLSEADAIAFNPFADSFNQQPSGITGIG